MAKSKSSGIAVPAKKLDPTLSALFSTSAGPVEVSSDRFVSLQARKAEKKQDEEPVSIGEDELDDDTEDEDAEMISEAEESNDESDDGDSVQDDGESGEEEEAKVAEVPEEVADTGATVKDARKRKRNSREEDDDLESRYLAQLQDDEPDVKRLKETTGSNIATKGEKADMGQGDADADGEGDDDDASSVGELVHESLQKANPAQTELEKANRTAFLSNVSVEAVTSAKAKKTLMAHLSTILDKTTSPPHAIESIRFRSTAFSTAAVPKRAAYAQKEVMDATTKSTNAYVVYNSPKAVRAAVNKLNGTIVLDRHLRVDSVAHPAPQDHKRCVFVGNLGFVNDETVLNAKVDEDGKTVTEKRKRTRAPMDVEEGLWRVFNEKAGKVESVRVVRDAATRVGKGIAYVQFYDANDVEAALLLAGKKFPPMLPRDLRVTRCKAPHKTARAMEAKQGKLRDAGGAKPQRNWKTAKNDYAPKANAKAQSLAGRAPKLLGRSAVSKASSSGAERRLSKAERKTTGAGRGAREGREDGGEGGDKRPTRKPEAFIFEGRRASAKDGKPKDLKFKGQRKAGAGRAAANKKRAATRKGGRVDRNDK